MLGWFQLAQLALGAALACVVVERARALLWLAPTSDEAMRWLAKRLAQGDREAVLAWARALPRTFVAQVLTTALVSPAEEAPTELEILKADLLYSATKRLLLLRVCATIASATGLLGGILAIRRGFAGGSGLIALEAGLAQQLAVSEALVTMALGVATSATCFYALSVFRRSARDLIAQSTQIAHLVAPGGAVPARPAT